MKNKLTKQRLDKFIYSIDGNDFNKYVTLYTYQNLSSYYFGETCLELGCADGFGTKLLLKQFKKVVAVDGSKRMLKNLKKNVKSKRLTVIYSMIEDLNLNERFDTIMIAHTIDIVDKPVSTLRFIKKFAHKKTRILIEVPNALSLHRQLGVMMGLIGDEHDLDISDKRVGHQRRYDMKVLIDNIRKAGLKPIAKGGFLLKPFSNSQMEKITNKAIIDSLNVLGKKYPNIAAEIYVVCTI